jgi:hypothetical protein
MKKIFAILLLSIVTCFAGNRFVSGKFVGGAIPYIPIPPSLLTSLFAYWKLDEIGTTQARLDSSINGVNLSPYTDVDYSTGLINNAYYCAENQDKFLWNTSSAGADVYGASEFTISFWVNWSLGPSEYDAQGIFNIGEGFYIHARPFDGVYNFLARTLDPQPGGNYYVQVNFGAPNQGSWEHVVVTRSLDGYLRFYVNNSLTDTVPISGQIISDSYDIFASTDIIFGRLVYGYPLNGSIDECGVWTRALTSLEVESLYNGGNGKPFNTF